MLKPLIIVASVLLAPTGPAADKVVPEEQTVAAAKDTLEVANEDKPVVDLHADSPPPTSWDQTKVEPTTPVDENTLAEQLLQGLIATVFVCLLIYLTGRFGLSRLTSLRTGAPTKTLAMTEKLSLDTKSSLYIIEVKDRGKLLLGGGDNGLRLICNLDETAVFGESMGRTQNPLVDSTPVAEVQKEHHG